MRTITITAALLFAAFAARAEDPITLKKSNVNVASGEVHEHSAAISGVKLPATGKGKTWDYSGLSGGAALTHAYFDVKKNKAFSKSAVQDTGGIGLFTPYETYLANKVYDEDKNGYFYAGDIVPYLSTPLEEVTGDPNDVLVIPAQNDAISGRDDIIQFPATKGSTWSSSYSKTLSFNLTLEFLGMYNVPCTEVSYTTVKNTVVGYGDLKIPASKKNNGKECKSYYNSKDFDALMIQREVVTVDSIFFNGVAAPAWLLSAFGTAQGAPTVVSYTESFYGENSWRPALVFDFGSDNTYSTVAGITYSMDKQGNGDDESVTVNTTYNDGNASAARDEAVTANPYNAAATALTLYPNPVNTGSAINARFTKTTEGTWNINVTNYMGQVVKIIPVSGQGAMVVPVDMGSSSNGLYNLNIMDEKGALNASAKFNLAK